MLSLAPLHLVFMGILGGMKLSFKHFLIAPVLLVIFWLFLLFIPHNSYAAGLPFGGQVTSIIRCNQGMLVYLKPAGSSPPSVMWINPSPLYRYNMAAPPHPGQYLLGMLGGAAVCVVGKIPVGGGPTIQFYGSSQ